MEVYRNASSAGSVSFAPGVTVPTGSAPSFVTIGDLDGDGKPDLVVANNGAGNITVIHNISSAGSIAFSAPATFTTGSGTFSVSIADIDGDGKPDLAVANQLTSGVSVLHNTSTVGSISFAAQVTFGVGYEPTSIAFGDIDGDGKPDMVVSNFDSNSVSILRNTSTVGAIAFAGQVAYHVGLSPRTVVIGDIDGDGKPDVAVANSGNDNVSVLRNTSTIGTISMAAPLNFAVQGSPFALTIGDINGDGKPDLVVVNSDSNSVSALANVSTAGTIAFAPMLNFATGLNPHGVSIADIDGDGRPDLSVASDGSNTLSVLLQLLPPQGSLTANGPFCGSGTGGAHLYIYRGNGAF